MAEEIPTSFFKGETDSQKAIMVLAVCSSEEKRNQLEAL